MSVATKILFLALAVAIPASAEVSIPASAVMVESKSKDPVKCPEKAPYLYRIAFSFFGNRDNPKQFGHGATILCLPRKIKTEKDWEWLQKRVETEPKISRISIMSAFPLVDAE